MLVLLPILALLLMYGACRKLCADWQRAVLAALVLWGVSVVAITELLSAFTAINRTSVALAWAGIAVAAALALASLREVPRPAASPDSMQPAGPGQRLDKTTVALLGTMALLVAIVAVTAIVSPPNVWDAMEYHLPRVVMWMSQHSVRFFSTPDYSQLMFGPWAEYAMMHLRLLWGSDRLVNCVELISFLGSLAGVSWIAKRLGAGPRGQALAVLACATIPEGVLEASGPMNTYVVSLWVVATIVFLLSWNQEPNALNTVLVGCSAGLAVLTKGSAYVYLPFLVAACWWMGKSTQRIRWLKFCGVFLAIILAINGPQYFRCYRLTGSPLGLPFGDGGPRLHWMVGKISPAGILANTIRNLSIHTVTPSASANNVIEHAVRGAISVMGQDPDDPKAIWPGTTFALNHFSVHEIHAGNPLHLLLAVFALVLLFAKRATLPLPRDTWIYVASIGAAFTMFCALLRWQIWESRHHLPLFVLGSVLIGLAMERYVSRRLTTAVGGTLLACALAFSLVNRTRSLVPWSRVDTVYHPRSVLYFNDQHAQIAAATGDAAAFVNRTECRTVAIDSYTALPAALLIDSPRSFFVYPIMALIHADGHSRQVWYAGVHNLTGRFNSQDRAQPCAVICLDCARVPEKWREYEDVGGRASVFDYIVVFSSQGDLNNRHEPRAVVSGPGPQPESSNP
jgi:Dolichyl-phosphate-mannose-protein mannosyltransferase